MRLKNREKQKASLLCSKYSLVFPIQSMLMTLWIILVRLKNREKEKASLLCSKYSLVFPIQSMLMTLWIKLMRLKNREKQKTSLVSSNWTIPVITFYSAFSMCFKAHDALPNFAQWFMKHRAYKSGHFCLQAILLSYN